MRIELTGKRAVITGGSRGIGRAIALACAEAGASVSICARNAEGLSPVRDEIAALGVTAHAAGLRCRRRGRDHRLYQGSRRGARRHRHPGVQRLGFGSSHDEAGWARSIDVDLLGTVRAIRAAVPFLEQSGAGSVINISSISGLRASARTVPYGAVKAALIEYTLSEAALLAKKGVRVNCIAPGSVEFPGGSWEKRKTEAPGLYNAILRGIPFGRLGRPRGNRRRRRLPRLPARQLGHRPDDLGRWRAAAVALTIEIAAAPEGASQ